MYHCKYRITRLSQNIYWDNLRPNSVSNIVNSFPGGRKIPGPSPGTFHSGFFPGKRKFSPTKNFPQENCPGGNFLLHRQNSLQRPNCISRFHHFTVDGNVPQKTDLTLDNFTISPLNHNNFTISP